MANPSRKTAQKSSDFSREIQQKRIDKGACQSELNLLDTFPSTYRISRRDSPFGVIVTVDLTKQLLQDVGVRLSSATFEMHLEGKFPFTPPTLTCVTHFTDPTIADGRDLLPHLITSPWSPSYTISSLITELPNFVKALVARGSRCALDLCSFSQESPLSLKTWDRHANMSIFAGKEVEADGQESPRLLVVTETVVLSLEPLEKYLNAGRLVTWNKLLALSDIRKQRLSPNKLTFDWKNGTDTVTQVFVLKEATSCIELISRNIERLHQIESAKTLSEDEVTQKGLRKVHINDILQAIAVYESNFDEKLNAELVNSLLGLYQQAIEYFSGMGDPRYDEFLDRMHCILSNDEVLAILRSGAEGQEERKAEDRKKEDRKPERRDEARSPLRRAIEADLVLETPLIETLPPVAKPPEQSTEVSSEPPSEPLFPSAAPSEQ